MGGNGHWIGGGNGGAHRAAFHSTPASDVWNAAGDAWTWAASIRENAAWTEYRRGCEANADADDALGLVSAAGGRVVDGDGMVDVAAMRRAADAMGKASASFKAVSGAFGRSARLCEEAAADEDRAAAMYDRGGSAKHAARSRDRAAKSRRHAENAARVSRDSGNGERALAEDSAKMSAAAVKWAADKGRRWRGDRAELAGAYRTMQRDSLRERVRSAEMLAHAADTERLSKRVRDMAADAARHMAEIAADGSDGSPGVQEAMSAWRVAVAAANRAEAEHAGRRMA